MTARFYSPGRNLALTQAESEKLVYLAGHVMSSQEAGNPHAGDSMDLALEELTKLMWPRLKQAWADGWATGYESNPITANMADNPYNNEPSFYEEA